MKESDAGYRYYKMNDGYRMYRVIYKKTIDVMMIFSGGNGAWGPSSFTHDDMMNVLYSDLAVELTEEEAFLELI